MSESSKSQTDSGDADTGALSESGQVHQNEQKREDKPRRSRALAKKYLRLGPGLLVALVLIVSLAYMIDAHVMRGRVLRNVAMAGVDLSRLSTQEAENRLRAHAERLRSARVRLGVENRVCEVDAERVAFRLEIERSLTRAFAAGRDGSQFERLSSWLKRVLQRTELEPVTTLDRTKLLSFIEECEAKVIQNRPFQGGFVVKDRNVAAAYPRAGVGLDRGEVERAILGALTHGTKEVALSTVPQEPRVSRSEVDRLVGEAQRAIAAPVTLKSSDGNKTLTLSAEELARVIRAKHPGASAARLELGIDIRALDELLATRRAQIEDAPEDATFIIDEKDQITIAPSRNGTRLVTDAVARSLLSAVKHPSREGELRLEIGAEPKRSTAAAQRLGITRLVSSFTTRHACCEARVRNIQRMAQLLDGIVVEPGQTFSVNELVGPRTAKNGFVPAPTIEEGEMVDTIGGGASQFATTMFNAIYFGGYDVVERQPHSYWFSRYPMGRDATLSFPKPDLIFRNDTQAGVLIKTSYTDTSITVKLYGENGGRKVRDEVSARTNIVKPTVELIANPDLEPDRERVKEAGMVGWSVTVKRFITFPDGTTREDRRKVTYKPRTRRVEVHPCRIPEGEKGYTGDPCPEPEDVEIAAQSEL